MAIDTAAREIYFRKMCPQDFLKQNLLPPICVDTHGVGGLLEETNEAKVNCTVPWGRFGIDLIILIKFP